MSNKNVGLYWVEVIRSIAISLLAMAVFWLVLLFILPGWAEERQSLRLKDKVVLNSRFVRLSDVVEDLSGIDDVILSPAPEEGDVFRWTGEDVSRMLALRGVGVKVEGKVEIYRREAVLSGGEVLTWLKGRLSSMGYRLEQQTLPNIGCEDLSQIEVSLPEDCAGHCYVRLMCRGRVIPVKVVPIVRGKLWRLTRDVPAGEVLKREDLEPAEDGDGGHAGAFPGRESPVGWTVRYPLKRGHILMRRDVTRRYVIKKGQEVKVCYRSGGVVVSTVGIAQENGLPAEDIVVANVSTGKRFLAEVVGPGEVVVRR